MKKVLSIILSIALLLVCVPLESLPSVYAAGNTTEFAGGSGTAEDPYLIATNYHLDNVRNFLSSNFKLSNDIDFTEADFAESGNFYNDGTGWEPIGDKTNKFTGIFDGNGYTIRGVRITTSAAGSYGLFANNAGTIKNLHVNGRISITTGAGDAGGIATYNSGTIIDCTNEVIITLDKIYRDTYAGGITAYNEGTIKECYNKAEIIATERLDYNRYVGGISGCGTANSLIENCYNLGDITAKATYYAFGTLTYGYAYAGGIQGCSLDRARINNCYNIGKTTARAYGISEERATAITYIKNYASVSNCYYLTNGGEGCAGATSLSAVLLKEPSALKGFDFEKIWTMGGDPNYPYPELQCFTLIGNLGVKGDVVYLSTVEPNLGEINRIDDSFTYEWLINGETVGTGATYIVQSNDIGKNLQCKLVGTKKHNMGTLYSNEFTVRKAKQTDVPVKPIVVNVTNTSLALQEIDGYEYRKDGSNWQTSNVFVGLSPNTDYTFYQRIAETKTHYASAQSGYTNGVTLKNSILAPEAPTVAQATNNSVTLTVIEGYEYSMDGFSWQKSNNFKGLNVFETYTFYQRIAETNTDYASASSAGTSFKVKYVAEAPPAPELTEKTNNKISVAVITSYEYSIDNRTWNTSGVFNNLQPNQSYSVYCRISETDTHYSSASSNPLTVTTLKNITITPNAPKVQMVDSNTVTLVAISDGEYSKDGSTWQKSNVFAGLSPNTEYTFYQRKAETDTTYVSEKSAALTVRTLKKTISAPSAPVLSKKAATEVTLVATNGYEYSLDGATWQASPVFSGLKANTTYTFYQRKAETNTAYASEKSEGLTLTTPKKTAFTPNSPVAIEITQTSVKLQQNTLYEYSKDGKKWQSSSLFENLQPATQYTFYQRVAESTQFCAGDASAPLSLSTIEKATCPNSPVKPIIKESSSSTITLLAMEGYEYKCGNGKWQDSASFSGLSAGTSYTFYQRIKETTTEKASNSSKGTTIKTLQHSYSTAIGYSWLESHIEENGRITSNGNKAVEFEDFADNTIFFCTLEATPDGIFCQMQHYTSQGNMITDTAIGFLLKPFDRYVPTAMTQKVYYKKVLQHTYNITGTIDRATYTPSTIIDTDGVEVGSLMYDLYQNNLNLLISYTSVYMLEKINISLSQVGFFKYIKMDGDKDFCDPATDYHIGTLEIRHKYEASCLYDGYTGDTICTHCGFFKEVGSITKAKGSHTYTNSCDTSCNKCKSIRNINHSYSNDCDDICNQCSTNRKANHVYDSDCDAHCNTCQNERKAPHIFDNSKDVICNGCGYERPPYTPGDLNEDDSITDADAVYLLMYTFFAEDYPINQPCDYNGDGETNDADAVYLLMYTFFPEDYPIE